MRLKDKQNILTNARDIFRLAGWETSKKEKRPEDRKQEQGRIGVAMEFNLQTSPSTKGDEIVFFSSFHNM